MGISKKASSESDFWGTRVFAISPKSTKSRKKFYATLNSKKICPKFIDKFRDGSVDKEEVKELRDSAGAVLSTYFGYGQTTSGSNYFYTRDQITSVRELLASAGSVQSQYGYSPYGEVTKLQSGAPSDFQYAGYYTHEASGLNLAVHRAYQARTGRWISRDPIGELDDLNLYSYVHNSPIRYTDGSGLAKRDPNKCYSEKCCWEEYSKCARMCWHLHWAYLEIRGLYGPGGLGRATKGCLSCCRRNLSDCRGSLKKGYPKETFENCPGCFDVGNINDAAAGMLMMMNPVCTPGGALSTR